MKKWNITIEAENEKDALTLIDLLKNTFEISSKFDLPLHHIYADMNGAIGNNLICEEVKQS